MSEGEILAGVIAPHPPHLVYGENPPQNEPRSECGWESLRLAYKNCRDEILDLKPDVLVVHTPHWQTVVGHHFLGLEKFSGLSVDPIFPHIFRYKYNLNVDVELSQQIAHHGKSHNLLTKMMTNPKFRVDYGSITSLHMINPSWDLPVVVISSNNSPYYFSDEVGTKEMMQLGQATKEAIKESGKKVVLLASVTLSHRHFTDEAPIVEDMSHEKIYSHNQYLWDMKVIKMMEQGKTKELIDILPEYIEKTVSEVKAGSLAWMLSALDKPDYSAKIHGYGTVIGTGNAIVSWNHKKNKESQKNDSI